MGRGSMGAAHRELACPPQEPIRYFVTSIATPLPKS